MGEILIQLLKIHLPVLIIIGGQLILIYNYFNLFESKANQISFSDEYKLVSEQHISLEKTLIEIAYFSNLIVPFLVVGMYFFRPDFCKGLIGFVYVFILFIVFHRIRKWVQAVEPFRKNSSVLEHYLDNSPLGAERV